jgi:hypothetical protein
MARPETLVAGNCYFSIGFNDRDLVLPLIDTLVYVGQEDDPEDGRMWLFKQPESASASDEVTPSSEPPTMVAEPAIARQEAASAQPFEVFRQRVLRTVATTGLHIRATSSYLVGPGPDRRRLRASSKARNWHG